LLLLVGNAIAEAPEGDEIAFDQVKAEVKQVSENPDEFQKFDIGDPEDVPPQELDVDPTLEKAGHAEVKEDYIDDSAVYTPRGGGMATGNKDTMGAGGFNVIAYGAGAKVTGTGGGIGVGLGTGKSAGFGGDGTGFGGRGSGHRKAMLAQYGGTKNTERAVTGALIWLARHQNRSQGNWSLKGYTHQCKDGGHSCTGPGDHDSDTGATAMGLLPFLAAGQTHKSKGPYQKTIFDGVNYLIRTQKPDGDLRSGNGTMYSHGLAAIALCEAYGLTGDKNVGQAAQGAINFILTAQNKTTGGWRYSPGDPGDTSVVGWQIMALKSAAMAGLSYSGGANADAFAGGSKWLDSCAKGPASSLYSYTPEGGPSNTMTSVGLLCRQYLGAKRDNPMMVEGMKYFLANLPDKGAKNVYYWYYATQVMHNMPGYEWDQWNRVMRRLLVETQCRDGSCANGSWDPAGDQWGKAGGRIMSTALSVLTLEIYYRYLPLFKADNEGGAKGGAAKDDAKGKDEAKGKKE
jgi:hypothetical protein